MIQKWDEDILIQIVKLILQDSSQLSKIRCISDKNSLAEKCLETLVKYCGQFGYGIEVAKWVLSDAKSKPENAKKIAVEKGYEDFIELFQFVPDCIGDSDE